MLEEVRMQVQGVLKMFGGFRGIQRHINDVWEMKEKLGMEHKQSVMSVVEVQTKSVCEGKEKGGGKE